MLLAELVLLMLVLLLVLVRVSSVVPVLLCVRSVVVWLVEVVVMMVWCFVLSTRYRLQVSRAALGQDMPKYASDLYDHKTSDLFLVVTIQFFKSGVHADERHEGKDEDEDIVKGTILDIVNGNLAMIVKGTIKDITSGRLVTIMTSTIEDIVSGRLATIMTSTIKDIMNGETMDGVMVQMAVDSTLHIVKG
jgi:hypothetical protein